MRLQNSYAYPFAASPSPKYSSSSGTSSTQSASANPDEDWTKISDLAERRRIQNRIAQRNYRKKLKRRLEDLEKRAGSSSASPEQEHVNLAPVRQLPSQSHEEETAGKRRTKTESSVSGRGRSPHLHPAQASSKREDSSHMFSRQYRRQLSTSPPPAFTYSYSWPEPPPIHAPYPQHSQFHSLPAPYSDFQGQAYLPPMPGSLPSMSTYDSAPVKSESSFTDEDMINHFSMSYSPMSAMEIATTQSYSDSNAYTPPLSISNSFEHSRTGSPCEPSLMCPGTPLSMGTPMSIPVSPHYLMG